MEEVRCPYLVVTSMCFIHKLWLDLHRSPQEIHRLVHKFPTSPQADPQVDPHSSIHTERSRQCTARTVATPTRRCWIRARPMTAAASGGGANARPASGVLPPSS